MEFKPLFPAGFNDITLDQLKEVFASPFDNPFKRLQLIERFNALIERFSEFGLSAEIWINGSFSTDKPEPNDIDVVFILKETQVNLLAPDKRTILLNDLLDNKISKIRYNCDVYWILAESAPHRSYWRGWFGYSREEIPKGIPRIFYGIH